MWNHHFVRFPSSFAETHKKSRAHEGYFYTWGEREAVKQRSFYKRHANALVERFNSRLKPQDDNNLIQISTTSN